jgi:hypothetical protein
MEGGAWNAYYFFLPPFLAGLALILAIMFLILGELRWFVRLPGKEVWGWTQKIKRW